MKYSIFYLFLVSITVLTTGCYSQESTDNNYTQETIFSLPKAMGKLENKSIDEASGLVASRRMAGYFWTHNDSGGKARIFLIDSMGREVGECYLEGFENRDWEDLTAGINFETDQPGGTPFIIVGEIGDNRAIYETNYLYRFTEPEWQGLPQPFSITVKDIDVISYQYPDGQRDAETLMYDPISRALVIVSKREDRVNVYSLPYPQNPGEMLTPTYHGKLDYRNTVAGDISPEGTELLIKNYESVFYYNFTRDSTPIGQLLVDTPPTRLPYIPEPQGESIAWTLDGNSYFTLSEKSKGIDPVLYVYYRN